MFIKIIKIITFVFIHLFLFNCFLVYIISILLLTCDKGTDLGYFIIIALALKFGVKVCFPKAVALTGGIREPLLTCSSFVRFGFFIKKSLSRFFVKENFTYPSHHTLNNSSV